MQKWMDEREIEYKMLAGLDLDKEDKFKQITILDYYLHLEAIQKANKKTEKAK